MRSLAHTAGAFLTGTCLACPRGAIAIGTAVFGTHARLASIAAGMAAMPATRVRAVRVQEKQPINDRTSGARRGHHDRNDEAKEAKTGERAMHLGKLPLGGHRMGQQTAARAPDRGLPVVSVVPLEAVEGTLPLKR
jgi:hypothetical protein